MRSELFIGKKQASITVEAALVLPIALSVILFFMYWIQIVNMEQVLYQAGIDAVEEAAACGYLIQYGEKGIGGLIADQVGDEYKAFATGATEIVEGAGYAAWFKNRICAAARAETIADSLIAGGLDGISFWKSDACAEDGLTVVCMNYSVRFPVFSDLLPEVAFSKEIVMRSFCGQGEAQFDEESEDGAAQENTAEDNEEVFVTRTGTVYHVTDRCTYIKLDVSSVSSEHLTEMRNDYGAKYYACESCAKGNITKNVWITGKGTRYHTKKDCGKITRNVDKIPVSEAKEQYRPCSRCACNH